MRYFLENLTGLSIYPLLSFVLFGSFFLAMLIWMICQPASYFKADSMLPLDPSDTPIAQ
jgi:cytochrome c oxidase cbb3-type subunit IV